MYKTDWKLWWIASVTIPATILVTYLLIVLVFSMKGNISFIFAMLLIVILSMFYNIKESKEVTKLADIKSNKYHNGWRGEDEVFHLLEKLSDQYTIFYGIKLPNKQGNIDFVLLGPCGVLAIEVKSDRGRITFRNGELLKYGFRFYRDIINQTMNEALYLNQFLKEKIKKNVFVKPVLVFSNEKTFLKFGLQKIRGIQIIQKEFLFKLIYSLPVELKDEEIKEIEGELVGFYK